MNKLSRYGALLMASCACFILGACGGAKVLSNPQEVETQGPLAVAADETITASVDWVIVKDGPGTWASNAFWDEYHLRVTNTSDEPVSVTRVQVVDSLNVTQVPSVNRKLLVAQSKTTEDRYAEHDLDVRPGADVFGKVAVGVVTGFAAMGTAAGVSASGIMGASSVASTASPALVTAVYLVPVLAVGGIVHTVNNSKVEEEIFNRHTVMPMVVPPGESRNVVAFFPLAPSPRALRVIYTNQQGVSLLELDTAVALEGLHIVPPGTPRPPRPREGSIN